METNDKLLKDFFDENKTEIADAGFSQRLMHKLPEKSDYSWVLGLFSATGVAVFLLIWLKTGMHLVLLPTIWNSVPIYYFLVATCIFPLLAMLFLLIRNKRYRCI